MGAANYIMQTDPAKVAQMPDAYQMLINSRPGWATAAFALAVFGGVLGCLLLLVRRSVAVHVLLVSFIGVTLTMAQAIAATGFSATVLVGTGMSLVVAGMLLWYARSAQANGLLK